MPLYQVLQINVLKPEWAKTPFTSIYTRRHTNRETERQTEIMACRSLLSWKVLLLSAFPSFLRESISQNLYKLSAKKKKYLHHLIKVSCPVFLLKSYTHGNASSGIYFSSLIKCKSQIEIKLCKIHTGEI